MCELATAAVYLIEVQFDFSDKTQIQSGGLNVLPQSAWWFKKEAMLVKKEALLVDEK